MAATPAAADFSVCLREETAVRRITPNAVFLCFLGFLKLLQFGNIDVWIVKNAHFVYIYSPYTRLNY